MTRKPVLEERRQEERRIGATVIFLYEGAKQNWKWLLVALMFLVNSPYAKNALELATGWSFSTKAQAAAPPAEELGPSRGGSSWKINVEDRLSKIEKQNRRILQILEAN